MDDCPVCKQPLTPDPQVGLECANPECPVLDDYLLWYMNNAGEWKVKKWESRKTADGRVFFTLSSKVMD